MRIGDEDAAAIQTAGELVELVEQRGAEAHEPTAPTRSPWSAVIDAAGEEHIPGWLAHGKGLAARFFFAITTALSRVVGRWLYRLRWEGSEHLPTSGPFLICPNHASFLDGPMIISNLPAEIRRRAFAVGAPVHVSGGFRTWFSRALGILPIDSDSHIRESMQTSAALLKRGGVLIIFPEGSRTFDGRLAQLRDGAAVLAAELSLPIVPCAVLGTFDAWPRQRRLPRSGRVTIRFGEPLIPAPGDDGLPESPARLTERIRRALLALGVDA